MSVLLLSILLHSCRCRPSWSSSRNEYPLLRPEQPYANLTQKRFASDPVSIKSSVPLLLPMRPPGLHQFHNLRLHLPEKKKNVQSLGLLSSLPGCEHLSFLNRAAILSPISSRTRFSSDSHALPSHFPVFQLSSHIAFETSR